MAEDGFKIADAYVDVHVDRDGLRDDIRRMPADVGPDVDRAGGKIGERLGAGLVRDARGKIRNARGQFASDAEIALAGLDPVAEKRGRESGSKVAQGFRQSFIRNSPLIVAAIGGALAAGAPVMLASASVLFGGIGAVVAAQSDSVRQAWLGLWNEIKRASQNDVAVLVPVFERMAGKIASGFQRMRPEIQDAFAGVAPQIDTFTDSLIQAAENALPGLTRAIAANGPVIAGFGSFLEDTGTGLTSFFDAMSRHAPEAGTAFAALGKIMAALLPILGELLGQGAELAAVILPPIASVLGVVASALGSVGGVLPAVVTGFAALKVAQTAQGWITGLGDSVSRMRASVLGVNPVTAALAATVGLLMTAHQQGEDRIREWTAALNEGGPAARTARTEMAAYEENVRKASSGFIGFILGQTAAGGAIADAANDTRDAKQANADYLASLTPLEDAQRRVGIAQGIMEEAVARYGATSDQGRAATDAYKRAQDEAARVADELKMAISGVTEEMLRQADQALASIDSGFAYRQSVDALEDAQAALTETINNQSNADANLRTSNEDVQRAQLALEQQVFRTASAWAQQQADLSNLKSGTAEYDRMIQTETLAELTRLRDAAGPQMRAAIDAQITALQNAGVSLDNTAGKAANATNAMQTLGGQRPNPQANLTDNASGRAQWIAASIDRIPLYKTSRVDVITNYISNYSSNQVAFRRLGGATGGNVGEVSQGRPAKGFSDGGKLSGPGTPTSDSIPARTLSGRNIALSDDEWIIKAMSSKSYGDFLMGAVNAGRATVAYAGKVAGPQGFANGGTPGRGAAQQVVSGAGTGTTIHVGSVVVRVDTPLNLMNSRDLRKAGEKMREVILDLEREQS